MAAVPPVREAAAEAVAATARAAGACVIAHGYSIRAFLRSSHTPPSAAGSGSGSGDAARTHPTNRQRENKSCGVPCANRPALLQAAAPLHGQQLSPHSREGLNRIKIGLNRIKIGLNRIKIGLNRTSSSCRMIVSPSAYSMRSCPSQFKSPIN